MLCKLEARLGAGDREMSLSPLNIYTFAAARGQFLRPDVQALLKNASVGLYSDFANSHDLILRREAEAVRERLDALLFGERGGPASNLAAGTKRVLRWPRFVSSALQAAVLP